MLPGNIVKAGESGNSTGPYPALHTVKGFGRSRPHAKGLNAKRQGADQPCPLKAQVFTIER
jgi:hypothetical protein